MEKKFSWSFLLVMIYTCFVCRDVIPWFTGWLAGSNDISGLASALGMLTLFTGIITHFFSVRGSWLVFTAYAIYFFVDALIGLGYCVSMEVRGDYLFSFGTGKHYVLYYLLYALIGIGATVILYLAINKTFP